MLLSKCWSSRVLRCYVWWLHVTSVFSNWNPPSLSVERYRAVSPNCWSGGHRRPQLAQGSVVEVWKGGGRTSLALCWTRPELSLSLCRRALVRFPPRVAWLDCTHRESRRTHHGGNRPFVCSMNGVSVCSIIKLWLRDATYHGLLLWLVLLLMLLGEKIFCRNRPHNCCSGQHDTGHEEKNAPTQKSLLEGQYERFIIPYIQI